MSEAVEALAAILRLAYSGELAAALAYRGHWKSVTDPDERSRIRQIEDEEWHHRELVGGLLTRIGMAPSSWNTRQRHTSLYELVGPSSWSAC